MRAMHTSSLRRCTFKTLPQRPQRPRLRQQRPTGSTNSQRCLAAQASSEHATSTTRRGVLQSALMLVVAAGGTHPALADPAPSATSASATSSMSVTAPDSYQRINAVAQQIEQDFVEKQYYVTGNLTKDLYLPNCRFVDPTTDVASVDQYTKAVSVLFDPTTSKAELISIKVASPTEVVLRWRLEGSLRIGSLRIKPYTGTTTYTLDSQTGLIKSHFETWDISAADAFLSTVFPNTGAPPAPPVEQLREAEGVKSG